jgi:hypothetical protein
MAGIEGIALVYQISPSHPEGELELDRRIAMEARQRIAGAAFGPDALKTIAQAFDEAWERIAGNFGTDVATVNGARAKLADAVLSVASENTRDVEELKKAALEAMALNYRTAN